MNLRWRLTLYYSALSTLIIVLAGVAFFVVLRQSLQSSLDKSLREIAEFGVQQHTGEPQVQISEEEFNELLRQLSGNTTIYAFDPDGKDLGHIGPLPNPAPLVEGFRSVGEYRVYTVHLDNGYWFQSLRSQEEIFEALGVAQRLLLIGLPILLLLGVGVGYLFADRALKPVDRVTGLAERIAASGQFKERVPEASGADEMARLTKTFNQMLAQLESTLGREKAFALAAAHELRTPIASLQARASLNLEKERSVERHQHDMEQMYKKTQEMSHTVSSLLALARTNQVPPSDVINLQDLVLEVAKSCEGEAEQRSMSINLSAEKAVTRGDATALRLALSNLVQNAIKYGREGGHLSVRSGYKEDEVFVEVCDDGPGVSDNDLERLRQPFQRGAGLQNLQGSGLGLALVSAIAEQHGGRLCLSRAVQGGVCALVLLPKD